jgi:tetratricopeptide (TPR) repeat protein
MRNPHRVIALVIGVTTSTFGVVSGSATADDLSPKDAALELFRDSDEHYQRGEFERAVELLERSYTTYPEPLVLYNLARALEGLGDFEGAVAAYQRYLNTNKNISDRRGIERRMATLRSYIAAAGPTNPVLHTSTQIGANGGRGHDRQTAAAGRWAWVLTGGGLAVIGAGAGVWTVAGDRHDQAVREPVQTEAVRLQGEADRLSTTATVLLVSGGAIAIGGVVWTVIDWRRGRRRTPARAGTARLQLAPTYVGVAWTLP